MQTKTILKIVANFKPMGPFKTLTAISAGLLASAAALGNAGQAQAKIYGFQCLKAGPASAPAYVIGLGNMPAPEGGTTSSSVKAAPLEGSNAVPIALVSADLKGYPVELRCSTIAARLTNLALATGTATPIGIINLTDNLIGGTVKSQPVIAIGKLSPSDVVATLGKGVDAKKAIGVLDARIERVAARKAIGNALKDGDIIEFIIYSGN